MRVLAIGDIHGCLTAFETLLEAVQPEPQDHIVTLGDYIDRGPDSRGVIERLLGMCGTGHLVPLRGNHEVTLLKARTDRSAAMFWYSGFGGLETMESYAKAGAVRTLSDLPDSHLNFIANRCLPYYETETHIFVHACLDPKLPLDRQPDEMLYWEKFRNPAPHYSGKVMVCGHTAQKTGVPANLGHAICIDTWVYGDGWLTCLDVVSGHVWQANQAGQQRESWITDYTPVSYK